MQKPGFDFAFSFDLDHAAKSELEPALQLLIYCARYLDSAGHASRFHPTSQIHGVAPEIVDELGRADYAGYNGTRVDSDSQL